MLTALTLFLLLIAPPGAEPSLLEDVRRSQIAANVAGPSAGGGVRIERKTVILERADGNRASVSFPEVAGLPDGEILAKVQDAVGLKAGTGMSLDEWRTDLRDSFWLDEIDYRVSRNRGSLLSLTYSVSGVGAYPDTTSTHLVVDLKTGRTLHPADIIAASRLKALVARLNKSLRAEVKRAVRKYPEEMADFREELASARFTTQTLEDFLVGERGVTFFFDFGFPHVVKALQPQNAYTLSYAELRGYLRPAALRGQRSRAAGSEESGRGWRRGHEMDLRGSALPASRSPPRARETGSRPLVVPVRVGASPTLWANRLP